MKCDFRGLIIALSLFGSLALAVQGTASPAQAYDINAVLPITGGASFLGKEEQQALQLAEPVINKSGGIQGQDVHFVFYDDQSNPQTGVQLTNRVIAAKPALVLGSSLVAVCNAMAPLMQDGPVQYCFSPGIHPAEGELRLHVQRLDARPCGRHDPLFPPQGVDAARIHDQRRRYRPGRRAWPR